MSNASGCTAILSPLGACLRALRVPDSSGDMVDVVLGLNDERAYVRDDRFIGVTAGRFSGRIARGLFNVHGSTVRLSCNDGPNHIHGGSGGLHRRVWSTFRISRREVKFLYCSPHNEEGYPGNLDVSVNYRLRDDNALVIEYRARSDADTVVNLTNHSYFNLSGHASGHVLDHEMQLASDRIAELDTEFIPTGRLLAVAGSPFDFRDPTRIGDRIGLAHPQLELARGFDHGWVLEGGTDQLEFPVATLYAPVTDIAMQVFSDQTSVQFYSGNNLPNSWTGKDAASYGWRQGLCLETQHLPNSPNEKRFPSTLLTAGETYASRTVFAFSTGRPSLWR